MGDFATLWPVLGSGGIVGTLVVVIVVLLRREASSAATSAQQVRDAENRADKAEERENAARQKAAERETVLQAQLDEALTARRRAEDLHAQVVLEVRQLRYKVERLETELARFTSQTAGSET